MEGRHRNGRKTRKEQGRLHSLRLAAAEPEEINPQPLAEDGHATSPRRRSNLCGQSMLSVSLFRRREQNQFDALVALDLGIVPRGNLKEISWLYSRFNTRLDHPDHELAAERIASVVHRTGLRISEEGLLVLFPGPAALENGAHPGRPGPHLHDGDATGRLHVQLLVRIIETPRLDCC